MRLKDKVAVVTGGGGGLGEGISLCLAREGAHVVVSDSKLETAEKVAARVREKGVKALAIQTDVRFSEQCQDMIDTALREMGGLDILVCSAGVGGYAPDREPGKLLNIENITDEDWDTVIDVNLKGVFLCNRAIIPHFKKQRSGKIINIASIGGRMPLDFLAHYDTSKAGVIALTQAVAMHMARYNVNVNSVCPGLIKTEMGANMGKLLSESHPVFRGMNPDDIFNTLVTNSVRKRTPQTAEDIGNAVVFLASEEGKEIVGQGLNVCGGMYFS